MRLNNWAFALPLAPAEHANSGNVAVSVPGCWSRVCDQSEQRMYVVKAPMVESDDAELL
jgi:hypothetical protein